MWSKMVFFFFNKNFLSQKRCKLFFSVF